MKKEENKKNITANVAKIMKECPHCQNLFAPSINDYLLFIVLICPKCNKAID